MQEFDPKAAGPAAQAAPGNGYVLLIEDNPGDAQLVRCMFEDAPGGSLPELRWRPSVGAGTAELATDPACAGVLLDLGLPDSHGLDGLEAVRELAHAVPVIVLSGNEDERIGIEAVIAGAQDYLVKGRFDGDLLRRALQYAAHRKQVEVALIARAMHDQLTGLPTRALLIDRLRMALSACQRNDSRGALLFVDLDRFKQVNDQHGHAAGDAVLRAVSERMRHAVRANDTVARVGGDEFIVLLPLISHDDDGEAVAQKLLAALGEPIPYGGETLVVSASIGVVEFQGAIDTAETLIGRADEAMYQAKREGRATVRYAF